MHKNKKEQIALNNAKVLERLRFLKQIKSQKLKNDNEINFVDSTQTKQFKIQSNRQSTHESKKQKKINKQSNKEITQKEYNQIKYGYDEQSAKNQQEEEMKRKKIVCSVNRKVTHNQSQSKQNCKQWKLQQVNEIVEFKGLRDERFLNDPAIGIEIDQSQTQKTLEQKDGKNNNRLYKNTHCNCKTGCNQKCSCKQFPKNCTKQCKCNRELCCRLIRSVKETLQK